MSFTVTDAQLRLEVADDGVVLPAQRGGRGTSVGLAAMAERAAELGGAITVGAPGRATSVVAVLPLRVGVVTAAQVGSRRGLKALIDSWPDIHLIGEAADGEAAAALAARLLPDVVVMA